MAGQTPNKNTFQNNQQSNNISDSELIQAFDLVNDANGEKMILLAEKIGRGLKDSGVTVSQIRKIFNNVKTLKNSKSKYYELNIMKAQLAYTAGRFKSLKNFAQTINKIIDIVNNDDKKIERFKDFFEAVVAYHRFHGGKE